MLSGDKAYQLFMTENNSRPLHGFLEEWKDGKFEAEAGYIIAVVGAYQRMCRMCGDGRYNGKMRVD